MSKNSQVSGRVQVLGTAWSADGYASVGKSNGSYQGVGQQSGLFAGDGGYHVDAGHVNLVGGAIASTNATHSELTAQTLTFSDLQNQMQHSTSSGSISGGYGGAMEATRWCLPVPPRTSVVRADEREGRRRQHHLRHADRRQHRHQGQEADCGRAGREH